MPAGLFPLSGRRLSGVALPAAHSRSAARAQPPWSKLRRRQHDRLCGAGARIVRTEGPFYGAPKMLKSGAILLLAWAALHGAEPITGTWVLKSQQVNGRDTASPPLTLRVTPSGGGLQFEYSAKESLRFAARLDGSPAEVTNSAGKKMGTARLTRGGTFQYRVMLEGPNRPTSNGELRVSNGGKTLTSISDAVAPGGQRLHTVQVFDRRD